MLDQMISPFKEQLFTELTLEETAIISGGQRLDRVTNQREAVSLFLSPKCTFSDVDLLQQAGKLYVTFKAKCPLPI